MQQTVVISGGGTGIGRAVVHRQVRDGVHVTVVGRRRGQLEDLQREFGGERVEVVSADVSTAAGADEVADRLAKSGRACAGMVAAAGGLSPQPEDTGGLAAVHQQWQACFESNVLSAMLLVEALRPVLEPGRGRVVLLSSVAALRGSAAAVRTAR